MPRISEFYGIAIAMYYAEQGVPHFHALYAGQDVSIAIDSLEIFAGSLPERALRLVREWAEIHRAELEADWRRARDGGHSNESHPSLKMNAMPELVHVTSVETVGAHRLRLSFEDGIEGEVDFSDWEWRGVFEPLADPAYFRQVELDRELGTIVWPNGADIAPETLHTWVTNGRRTAAA